MTDDEIHDRITHDRPPFVSPMQRALSDMKERHAAHSLGTPEQWDGRRMPSATYREELRAAHPGSLLLFRICDFYELFETDAVTASKCLGLTLNAFYQTGIRYSFPVCGFPYHRLDTYLTKLVRLGNRVAIVERTAT